MAVAGAVGGDPVITAIGRYAEGWGRSGTIRATRVAILRALRHAFGNSQIISGIKPMTTIAAASGCASASHNSPPTARSSVNDAAQLENGSGDVLMTRPAARLREVAAGGERAAEDRCSERHRTGRIAENARGECRAGGNADEGLHDIPERIDARHLVRKKLDEAHEPCGHEHQRMRERREARRQIHEAQVAGRADDEQHRVEPQSARDAERTGEGQQLPRVEIGQPCSSCNSHHQTRV